MLPNLKKRYIVAGIAVIYVGLKIWTSFTVNTNDDDLPDRVKDVLLRMVFINPTEGELNELYAESETSEDEGNG